MDDTIRCSGDDGRRPRAVPRREAEAAVTAAPFTVRGFPLDRGGGRWLVYAGPGEIDRVRCPEHRDSVL